MSEQLINMHCAMMSVETDLAAEAWFDSPPPLQKKKEKENPFIDTKQFSLESLSLGVRSMPYSITGQRKMWSMYF